jgi:hypothetical protein
MPRRSVRPRVYIVSKVSVMEAQVRSLKKKLERLGFSVNYDWTESPALKPYGAHPKESCRGAIRMSKAAFECDILIVLWSEGGVGFHIETGIALGVAMASAYVTGRSAKRIYVVGEGIANKSIFYHHPHIRLFNTEDEVLAFLARNM